jgi:hypothetical protein
MFAGGPFASQFTWVLRKIGTDRISRPRHNGKPATNRDPPPVNQHANPPI